MIFKYSKRKNSIQKFLFVVCLFFFHKNIFAKSTWRYIENKGYKIFFKEEMEDEAQRVAVTLERIHEDLYKDFGDSKKKKTKIILKNDQSISNGTAYPDFVIFYTLPNLEEDHTDFLTQLCLHEGRHAAQFYSFFDKIFKIPLHVIPEPWLFEGDAVLAETKFSYSGRGRLPSFFSQFRCNVLERQNYSFEQNYLGDTENLVSNHYVVGYLLRSFLEKKYSKDVLKNILDEKQFFLFLNQKIKKVTKKNMQNIYDEMVEDLKSKWREDLKDLKFSEILEISIAKERVLNQYFFPKEISEGKYLAFRTDINNNASFVILDEKKNEDQVLEILSHAPARNGFSFSQGLICWSERRVDPLLSKMNVAYRQVVLYDLKNRKEKIFKHKTNYLIPEISPSGKSIAALECSFSYKNYLVILDSNSGEVKKKISLKKLEVFKSLSWSEDENEILAVSTLENKTGIISIDANSGSKKILYEYSHEAVSKAGFYGSGIIFCSPENGVDCVYFYDIKEKKKYLAVVRPYGIYNYSVLKNEKDIVCAELTKNGMQISKSKIEKKKLIKVDSKNKKNLEVVGELKSELADNIFSEKYKVHEYTFIDAVIGSFGFSIVDSIKSSWDNFAISTNFKSKDVSDRYDFLLGGMYKVGNKSIAIPVSFSINDLYPSIKIYANGEIPFDERKKIKKYLSSISEYNSLSKSYLGVEIDFPYKLRYPLSYDNNFSFKINSSINYISKLSLFLMKNYYSIDFSRNKYYSVRSYYSTWSQFFKYKFGHTIFLKENGYSHNISLGFTMPGFWDCHSVLFGGGVSFVNDLNLEFKKFKAVISFKDKYLNMACRSSYSNIGLEYVFPIMKKNFYKSFGALQRIFLSGFFEYQFLKPLKCKFFDQPKTLGFHLISLFNIMRQQGCIGFGGSYTFIGVKQDILRGNTWGFDFSFRFCKKIL